jgi:hypothetical protein
MGVRLSVHPPGFHKGTARGIFLKTMSTQNKVSFSIPSIISVIAAIFSFRVGATGGLLLAVIAIVFGLIGFLLSLSPSVRGGIVSLFGIFAGLIGIIAAVVKAIQWFF